VYSCDTIPNAVLRNDPYQTLHRARLIEHPV
jgi:hypothetical protein